MISDSAFSCILFLVVSVLIVTSLYALDYDWAAIGLGMILLCFFSWMVTTHFYQRRVIR
jgi:hypothetical protein